MPTKKSPAPKSPRAPVPLTWHSFPARPSREQVEAQVRAFVAGMAAKDSLAMFAACPRYHSSQPYIRERDREWEKREVKSVLKGFVDHNIVAKDSNDAWHEKIDVASIEGDERNVWVRLSFAGTPTKYAMLFAIAPHGSEWVVAYQCPRVMPL